MILDYLKEQHTWKVVCPFVGIMAGVKCVIMVGIQMMLL